MQKAKNLTRSTNTLVILFFVVVTLIFIWPLPAHLTTHVIGPFEADNLEYIWKLWWVKESLFETHQSLLIHPDIYYPYGYASAYGVIAPFQTILGSPLTALVGPILTYNTFIIFSFILSGFFTYLYIRRLTGSVLGGVIAGTIFSFSPYHLARAAGNFNVVSIQWIPLFFLFLDQFIENNRVKYASLTAFAFIANTLTSWYYGAMLMFLTPFYYFSRTKGTWQGDIWKTRLRGGIIFAGISFFTILPFLMPYLQIQTSGEGNVPLDQVTFWAASVTDYLTPNIRNFLWGPWVQTHLSPFSLVIYEFIISWGFVPSALALLGWRRGRAMIGRGWGILILIAFTLSLGPALKLFSSIIYVPSTNPIFHYPQMALDWIGQHSLARENFNLAPEGNLAIPLPGLFVRWFVPGFTGMRSWGRFAIFATFGISVLAGVGVHKLIKGKSDKDSTSRFPKINLQNYVLTGLIAGLVLFEFYAGPQQLTKVEPRPVDIWLASQPEKNTIIQMPLIIAVGGSQMYYTMYNNQNLASGNGTYFPTIFEERYPELRDFPSDESLDLLANWGEDVLGEMSGVRYILVDRSQVPEDEPLWEQIANQDRLELVTIEGTVRVYQIKEPNN
ncbi:MAG: hypothetical protein FVQ83_07465 [Chloroflexi bacterium]|nr:hypothetical protein [Chloroflexota bacterium]